MVTVINGNLFDSPAQTLVNTINCVGVMGKGIALEYKKRYPEMFVKYKDLCNQGLIQVGKLWLYKSPDKWILNFPTKKHWKDPSKIEYVLDGLNKFVNQYESKGITSCAFPLLGASNGGLNPEMVLDVMKNELSKCNIEIFIYANGVQGSVDISRN